MVTYGWSLPNWNLQSTLVWLPHSTSDIRLLGHCFFLLSHFLSSLLLYSHLLLLMKYLLPFKKKNLMFDLYIFFKHPWCILFGGTGWSLHIFNGKEWYPQCTFHHMLFIGPFVLIVFSLKKTPVMGILVFWKVNFKFAQVLWENGVFFFIHFYSCFVGQLVWSDISTWRSKNWSFGMCVRLRC